MLGEYDGMYQVICSKCHGTVDEFFDSPEEAVAAWNTRPIENELEAENARLREALGKIIDETKDYERRLPGPSFVVIRIYAEKALKGDEE